MKDINIQDSNKMQMEIPLELSGIDLRCYLYPPRFDDPIEKHAVEILHKICLVDLTDKFDRYNIETTDFTQEERDVIINYKWCESANLEIKARCNDVIGRYENDKREKKIKASELYLDLYDKYLDIEFLLRSITVRSFKSIVTDDFIDQLKGIILQRYDHPFWIENVVISLKKSFSNEKLKWLSDFIETKKNKSKNNNNFSEEREYVKSLLLLNAIGKLNYHKEMALSFEKEADAISNNKKENTYYPNLVNDYQNAFNEAFVIKEQEPELHERIKIKLLKEKTIFMEILSIGGVQLKYEIPADFKKNVEEVLSVTTISSFKDTINLMLSIPFVMNKEIDAYLDILRKASILDSISGQSNLNDRGNTVGNANPSEALRTEAHIYIRHKRLYLIQNYLYLHRWSKIHAEEVLIYYYLKYYKPKFVEEDNVIFWAKGIYAGLNGDFVTASFVLTPQLENALLNIVEIKDGDITTLEKKRQLSPTLGAIIPRLNGVFNEEALFEIDTFLQGEIDVNFRNNLLHGLFKPFEIEKYGPYLWWLSMKLYFDEFDCIKSDIK